MFENSDIDFKTIESKNLESFIKIIKKTEDKRYQPNVKHSMSDIILITLFTVMAKASEWTEIEAFGKKEEKWLKKYLELQNGIPSHDTIQRVISLFKPEKLYKNCLNYFIEIIDKYILKKENEKDILSLDGKTTNDSSRSKLTTQERKPLNTMSVYSHNYGVSIIQDYIEEKSNQIPMGEELLKQLDLKNTIVTVDALNTQKNTVKAVIEGKGNYVFALKENQKNFYKDIKLYFEDKEELEKIKKIII